MWATAADDRRAAADGGTDPDASVTERTDATADRPASLPAFVETMFADLFETTLQGRNRAVVEQSFEHLADGDWAGAERVLRERFESICERRHPELPDSPHPAACHLYDPPSGPAE
jgi:peptide/nickel transport system ATP-binding protein